MNNLDEVQRRLIDAKDCFVRLERMTSERIVILYNETETLSKGEFLDLLAERGVLKAVDAVEESLSQLNFTPIRLPIKERSFSFLNRLRQLKPSLVFNLCEGLYGESELEATIPGMLEILQIPYTGNRALTLSLCLRKDFCKSILARHRVPTARFQIMRHLQEPLARSLTFPLIVKPSKEDASLGITNASVVYNESELSTQVGYIWERYQQPALVEEFIEGREFNVSVLGDNSPEVLPISEIDFSQLPSGFPKIVSYQAKWVDESKESLGTIPNCPADLTPRDTRRIAEIARRAYTALEGRDYARVDIRMRMKDQRLFVLEVNPNPDIAPDAGLPRSAAVAGLSYSQLIGKIVGFALKRAKIG